MILASQFNSIQVTVLSKKLFEETYEAESLTMHNNMHFACIKVNKSKVAMNRGLIS